MMATFDSMSSSMTESMTANFIDPVNKQPLKRLEPTIQRFTKIALPTDLGRLLQHKKMIKRCREQEDWDKLNTEQINARLTVQQLKANIREMDKARCQIRDEDLPALDSRVNPLKEEAMEAIASFILECGMETLTYTLPEDVLMGGNERVVGSEQTSQGTEADERNHIQDQARDEEVEKLRRTLEETKHVEETWNKLKGDLEDVSTTIQDFAQQVKQQKELTDRIEDNIDTAQTNVLQGARSIITVSNIKNVMLPLTGALLGTAVGGPIGLLVGYKVGAVAAFGGGAVGFLGARIAKRKSTDKNNKEIELIEEEQRTLSESQKDTDTR